MRGSIGGLSLAGLAGAVLLGAALSGAAPAAADYRQNAMNGRFQVTSDGQWVKINEVFQDGHPMTSTWTVTSVCTGAFDCTGQVTSDHGWSAPAVYRSEMWFVVRVVDGWQRCPDGSTEPGRQIFKFYRDRTAPGVYRGWDTTTGPSGGCGRSLPLNIEMPLTLVAM